MSVHPCLCISTCIDTLYITLHYVKLYMRICWDPLRSHVKTAVAIFAAAFFVFAFKYSNLSKFKEMVVVHSEAWLCRNCFFTLGSSMVAPDVVCPRAAERFPTDNKDNLLRLPLLLSPPSPGLFIHLHVWQYPRLK